MCYVYMHTFIPHFIMWSFEKLPLDKKRYKSLESFSETTFLMISGLFGLLNAE